MPRATSFAVLALSILALAGCAATSGRGVPAPAADVAIVGVTTVDPASGEVRPDRTVLVRGGTIAAIRPATASDRGAGERLAATVLDGAGRWLIPGLWDGHVHVRGGADLAEENRALLPLYVANGVTSVRDAGGDLTEELLDWRRRIAAGELVGPTIYTSGPKIDGPRGGWDGSLRPASPAEVPAALDSLQALGADYVKIYDGSIGADVFLAVVREAERRGLPVTGHMPFTVRFLDAVEAGLDGTEHLYYAFKGAATNEDEVTAAVAAGELGFWNALALLREGQDPERAARVWRAMARAGTAVVPTLHIDDVLGHVAGTDHSADPELRYVPAAVEETYRGRVESARRSSADARRERIERHDLFVRMLGEMHRAGVPVVAGSDAGPFNSYVYPGWSLHEELEDLVEAGLSPLDALRSATVRPAELLGVDDRVGRLVEGHRADLVLLEADPTADIGATRRIAAVVQANGDVHTAADLGALLRRVER